MTVLVTKVRVPAMSTIGFVDGVDEAGNSVSLAMDWRPARNIGLDIQAGEVVEIEPEDYMVLAVTSPKEEAYRERGDV